MSTVVMELSIESGVGDGVEALTIADADADADNEEAVVSSVALET